jgi:hypothetical protein
MKHFVENILILAITIFVSLLIAFAKSVGDFRASGLVACVALGVCYHRLQDPWTICRVIHPSQFPVFTHF